MRVARGKRERGDDVPSPLSRVSTSIRPPLFCEWSWERETNIYYHVYPSHGSNGQIVKNGKQWIIHIWLLRWIYAWRVMDDWLSFSNEFLGEFFISDSDTFLLRKCYSYLSWWYSCFTRWFEWETSPITMNIIDYGNLLVIGCSFVWWDIEDTLVRRNLIRTCWLFVIIWLSIQ